MKNQIVINSKKKINFGDKVWSTKADFNGGWPWGFVGVLGNELVTFNGDKGGVDVFSKYGRNDFNCYYHYRMAVTVGSNDKAGNLLIEGGVYKSLGSHCIYVMQGTCEITGGVFFTQPSSDTPATAGHEQEKYGDFRNYLLNCLDANYKNGKAKIIVKGGSFVGFDPADNFAEGAGTNFVAKGYKSIQDGTWTYRVKDVYSKYHNQMVTVPVYKVVSINDSKYTNVEGIEGNVE